MQKKAMSKIKNALWLSLTFLSREWKAVAAVAIALYVAIPLVGFLESHTGSIGVSLSFESSYPTIYIDGELKVRR